MGRSRVGDKSNAVILLTTAYNNAVRSAGGVWQIAQIRAQAKAQIRTTTAEVKAANDAADALVNRLTAEMTNGTGGYVNEPTSPLPDATLMLIPTLDPATVRANQRAGWGLDDLEDWIDEVEASGILDDDVDDNDESGTDPDAGPSGNEHENNNNENPPLDPATSSNGNTPTNSNSNGNTSGTTPTTPAWEQALDNILADLPTAEEIAAIGNEEDEDEDDEDVESDGDGNDSGTGNPNSDDDRTEDPGASQSDPTGDGTGTNSGTNNPTAPHANSEQSAGVSVGASGTSTAGVGNAGQQAPTTPVPSGRTWTMYLSEWGSFGYSLFVQQPGTVAETLTLGTWEVVVAEGINAPNAVWDGHVKVTAKPMGERWYQKSRNYAGNVNLGDTTAFNWYYLPVAAAGDLTIHPIVEGASGFDQATHAELDDWQRAQRLLQGFGQTGALTGGLRGTRFDPAIPGLQLPRVHLSLGRSARPATAGIEQPFSNTTLERLGRGYGEAQEALRLDLITKADDALNAAPNTETQTIFKAPQPGKAHKLLNQGFHPEDFAEGDLRAYFAKERALAEEYAKHYGDGVLEVEIRKSIYDQRIRPHEVPYLSDPNQIEIPLPHSEFDVLNNAMRRLHAN